MFDEKETYEVVMMILEMEDRYIGTAHSVDLFQAIKRGVKTVKKAYNVSRERHKLLELDDKSLEDIGLTRQQATKEGQRPFWDLSESKD